MAAWETTTDIGIPSFFCCILDERAGGSHDGAGAGCHPVGEIALLRALSEAIQVRNTSITGSRDDLSPGEYRRDRREERRRRVRLLMRSDARGRDFQATPSYRSDSFAADLRWLLQCLQGAGIDQVLAVDLRRAEFEIPVVRIVIPGLEAPHDDDGYVAGPRARAVSSS